MKLLNKLTIKNLKLNKKRTIVTIIGIMLSVALITAVTSIYTSGINSLISFETYQKGDFHVAYYNVPIEDLDVFKNNREIENINLVKNIGYAKINSKNDSKPYAYVKAFTKSSLENLSVKLVEGRLPENDSEIVIPTHLKTNGRLTFNVGDVITLDIGDRISLEDEIKLYQNNPFQTTEENTSNEDIINTTSKTYKIVGIIERPATNIESYFAPGYTFITLNNEKNELENVDVYAKYTKDGTKHAYKLTANILGVDEQLFEKVYTGTATHSEMEKYSNSGFEKEKYDIDINTYLIDLETNPLEASGIDGLVVVVCIVIGIIIFTSVFCIKNSFDISITEKVKQYGMLRSIGATKKQIKRNVFYEATILGIIGIPLGIILGFIASYILINVSNYFLGNSLAIGMNLKFSFSVISIIISIILGIITIYFSAFKSARKAAKVSPIDSIRNSANIKINSKKIKSPKLIKKIFGMGGEISFKNLKRNKKKYRTTVISIIVSVFVFIALSSFMNMAFDSVKEELKISEYNISLYSIAIKDKDILNKYIETTKLDNIEDYTILRQISFEFENRKLNPEYIKFLNLKDEDEDNKQYINIYSLGSEQYKKYIDKLGLNYEDIKDKGILMDYRQVGYKKSGKDKMSYKTMRLTAQQKGDILSGVLEGTKDFEIEIGFISKEKPFGLKNNSEIFLIISEELMEKISTEVDSNILSIFYKSSNANKLQDDIDELLKNENYNLDNIEENAKMMNSLFTLIGIFLYGFIIVISLIGITNIFNTITTNMELRKQEFAMLKSVGMTTKEFNRMIRLETLFMGIKSLIFGIPIGILLSYLIYHFLAEDSGLPYELPLLAILLSVLVVFILISLIMKYSMNKINKQNTIETIRNENI